MIYDLVPPIWVYQLALITGFWLFRSDLKAVLRLNEPVVQPAGF